MDSLRVIIAGGRDFTNVNVMATALNNLQDVDHVIEIEKLTLICGMARGADLTAYKLFSEAGLPVEKYPANWDQYGKQAGYIRNTQMANVADMLIAFWDGESRGTAHMIHTARARNLKVLVFNYEGNPL